MIPVPPYVLFSLSAAMAFAAASVRARRQARQSPGVSRAASGPSIPAISPYEEDDVEACEPAAEGATLPTVPLVVDYDASVDEPTAGCAKFAVTASGRSHPGRVRRRNEDAFLLRDDLGLFVVADGMGGARGGQIASRLAVHTIDRAFLNDVFDGKAARTLPTRAGKLARAIHMANTSIRANARADRALRGMGTTVVAALFAAEKRRLYVGHVGDSRCYRLRSGRLEQLTQDHTLATLGVRGDAAAQLARVVGTQPRVPTDVIVAEPAVGDLYLLCTDGLSKMVPDDDIRSLLAASRDAEEATERLVTSANDRGGRDNVTVVVVRVGPPLVSTRPRQGAP